MKPWAPCLLFVVSNSLMAQTPPSAGGQMQQLPLVPVPPSSRGEPVALPQTSAPAVAAAATLPATSFVGQRLSVSGASAFSEAELVRVAGFEPGRSLVLGALHEMAKRITQHYRQRGYLVAQVYLPAQEIQNGVVHMTVLEGQYGQVVLNNTSTLDDAVPRGLLNGLNYGDAIRVQPLQERLLLLSQVPGVQVQSTLVPGATLGLSDLVVTLEPGPLVSGSVDADNAGNRYTGEQRLGASVQLNNPSGQGDLASLRALTAGAGLNYLRGAYQTPVGRGHVGGAYSVLAYQLGQEFSPLRAHGDARTTTLFGGYPLVRSPQTQVNVGVAIDHKVFQDRLDVLALVTDKRVQVLTASLQGENRDAWGGGGLNTFWLAGSLGKVTLHTPAARVLDASTANSSGQYQKLAFAVSRWQQAAWGVSLGASLRGQMASQNLDVSEKMELGGMHGVRAYPEGEAYADEGYVLTLALKKPWQALSRVMGPVQGTVFVDVGRVKLNHRPWEATSHHRQLSAAGVGLDWTHARDLSVKVVYARKWGKDAALSAPDKSGRFWVQGVFYF